MIEPITVYRLAPDGERPIADLETARTPFARLFGLLGRARLGPGKGLLLDPCGVIHTFGMRFPIDALFLDKNRRITRIHRNVGPMRMARGGKGSAMVIEIQSGWLPPDAVTEGDQLVFRASGAV
jgi:uncharacterized protein